MGFGAHLCYAYAAYQYTFSVANIVLINLLSLNKLLRCLHPLRNMHPTRFQRIMVPGLTSLISLIPMLWIIVGLVKDFMAIPYFHREANLVMTSRETICSAVFPHLTEQSWAIQLAAAILPMLCNGMFCLTLVITTAVLIVYAIRKTNRSINKRNIFIVILVTVSFLLSYLPHFIFTMFMVFVPTSYSKHLSASYDEISKSLTLFSSWSNPIIYVVVNESFKEYTRKKICVRARSS